MTNSEKLWRTRAKVAFPMYKVLLEIDRKRHPTEKQTKDMIKQPIED